MGGMGLQRMPEVVWMRVPLGMQYKAADDP
jgi:hypothetical protein